MSTQIPYAPRWMWVLVRRTFSLWVALSAVAPRVNAEPLPKATGTEDTGPRRHEAQPHLPAAEQTDNSDPRGSTPPSAGSEQTPRRAPGPRRSIKAVRTREPMRIDGHGAEAVWKKARPSGGFREREPLYGGTPPLRTEVKVAYDDRALYVLVWAESDPGRLRARTLRRDDLGVFDDDGINLKLDPNHNFSTSFNFTVNTRGAQQDAVVLEDGSVFVPQWDGVWQAEVTVGETGYTTEYRIPFAILGVQKGSSSSMGFNINRVSVTPLAKYDWQLPAPPQRFNAPSTYGEIKGLTGIETGRALELTPYVSARTDFQTSFELDPRARPNVGVGIDARLQTGAGSYAELSVLTDFSQVAADQVQVASDRFPLFFPEQRPFFINGLSVLRFGQAGVRQPFDPRRIGRDGDRVVPIVSGLKAYGRAGALSYAALNVQTLERKPVTGDTSDAGTPPENFSAGRVRYSLTPRAWIGLLASGKHRFEESGNDHYNLGLDAEVRSDDGAWDWYSFVSGTHTETRKPLADADNPSNASSPTELGPTRRGLAAYTRLRYHSLLFRPVIDWAYSQSDFDPQLGFYRETGVAEHFLSTEWVPQINRYGIQEASIEPTLYLKTTDDYQRILNRSGGASFALRFNNQQELAYAVVYQKDQLPNDFDLFGFTVEQQEWQGFEHTVQLSTPARKNIEAFFGYTYAEAFGGFRHTFAPAVAFRPSPHFVFDASFEYLLGRLDDASERFAFGFANASLVIAINRDISLDALGRFSLEPGQERLGVQTRLRYRFLPGSDLFVVHRHNRGLANNADSDAFNELTLKLTYYYQHVLGF